MSQFKNSFSEEIYNQTYRYMNETLEDTQLRVAKDIASVETDKDFWTERFYDLLQDFKFVPGGRIFSNAGTGLSGTGLLNCHVSGFKGENQDSMEGIMDELKRQALILKSEGGYGFCADVMRPRGAFISGIASESPGAVEMLKMWDMQSFVITKGSGQKSKNEKAKGKIRKGAQMVTMSCWHPSIEEFITAKQTAGVLAHFNMSVLITDKLMQAVEDHQPWELIFPDIEADKALYNKTWDGDIEKWIENGGKVVVYKKFDDATQLYDLIMKSTYTRNEPGVLFVDTINRLNPLYYIEHISATNPCGEQPLATFSSCCLGSINLTQYVHPDGTGIDYEKLKKDVHVAVRFLDNVNSVTKFPLKEQEVETGRKRRIGLGLMGYGSALMMMKIRYGSTRALEITHCLMNTIVNEGYIASSLIAAEKGSFELFDADKYLSGEYIKTLNKETLDCIRKHGLRNSHITTVAPTGNTGVMANNVSGGLEPVFMPKYIRTTICPSIPDGITIPKNIDWSNRTYNGESWDWIKEGDVNMLTKAINGKTYKIDSVRGLCEENVVMDYAVQFLSERGEWDDSADWSATTTTLTVDEHINTMDVISKYLCSSASKTINIPNSYTYEDFKDTYLKMYKTGTIKGGTTYRAGTMTAVLSSTEKKEEKEVGVLKTNAPKRPAQLNCDIHEISSNGKKYIVLVGLLNGTPYEVFSFKKDVINISSKIKSGIIKKTKISTEDGRTSQYNLIIPDILEVKDICQFYDDDAEDTITRLISNSLRHGSDMTYVYEQLNKSKGSIVSFSKSISRALKKYTNESTVKEGLKCPSCGGTNYRKDGGCSICPDCGYSACS